MHNEKAHKVYFVKLFHSDSPSVNTAVSDARRKNYDIMAIGAIAKTNTEVLNV